MSKADGWIRVDSIEWRKEFAHAKGVITRVIGGGGFPYVWDVYPLPRKEHVGADGRYRAIGSGRCARLCEAKEKADALMSLPQ